MYIRVKPTSKPNNNRVQICECVRQGPKVKQVIIRHVGIAQNEEELKELKSLANILISQIRQEREGPYLFPIEQPNESDPDPQQENVKIENTDEPLIVDLHNLS